MTPISFQGILFDLDGTLVNNMMVHHRAWQQKLRELGLDYPIERVKEEIHGINVEILDRLFGDQYGPEELQRFADEKEASYRELFAADFQENIVAGVQDFIHEAYREDVPMAIATASPEKNATFAMQHLGITKQIPHLVHSGMVAKGKPDPEVFQLAADRIDVPLADCLIFEDSVTGARAANNAGCPVVIITTTHQREEFEGLEVAAFREDFRGLMVERRPDGFLLAQ
jgi:beta-phosphoglucomutase